MSKAPPKIERQPPTIQETTEEGAAEESDPNQGPGLNPPSASIDDKRGSVQLSVISDESRRQSLFGDDEDEGEDSDQLSEGGEDDDERKRKRDEVFVDKTRAAMVVIGAKDIKEALERKKAVEISRRTPEAKVAHILFHQAKFLMQQSRFGEALLFVNRALAVDPERKDWLTEKSRCYLSLLQPEIALQHVNQVLKKDPCYFKAIVLKGEILYSLWDLEKAMLCFVEGRRMRPDNTECIEGVHKVKMALEDIAAFKVPRNDRKKKTSKKRSKSAKGRLTSASPTTECIVGRHREPSLSSRRPSSRLSPLSEASLSPTTLSPADSLKSIRPSTAHPRGRMESPISMSRSQNSEVKIERPMSAKGKRGASARPKTAAPRRSRSKSVSRDLEIDDIRRFVRESMSGSYKSSTHKCFSENTQQSVQSGFASQSFSSSMEDVSQESEFGKFDRTKLPKVKTKKNNEGQPRTAVTPGTKVSSFLSQDRMFLDSLLKDKDLKRSKTAYTKRALRIAQEVQSFVTERERYWKNRENFIRHAKTDEDTLI